MSALPRTFIVRGMRCAGCSKNLEKAISALPGAENVSVNYANGTLTLTTPTQLLPDALIFSAVKKLGFTAELPPESPEEEEKKANTLFKAEVRDFAIAAFFSTLLLCVAFTGMVANHRANGIIQLLLLIPAVFAGRRIFSSGIPALLKLRPDMDSLIACSAGTGIIYSLILLFKPSGCSHLFLDASAMILTLVMLGRLLEKRARDKVSGAIKSLLKLSPEQAALITDKGEISIPASQLQKDQTVRVRAGEKIPADGIVVSGSAYVNETMLTGEELPVSKVPGSTVSGGTINTDGVLEIKVTAAGSASLLGRIIKLVSDAQNSKPPIAALADKVSGIFTWIIFSAALITFVLWHLAGATLGETFNYALSVLVAACPCALGLATPIALIAGIGRGAASGILIKNGTVLENCAKAKTIIFDKTGTLTSGIPEIRQVYVYPGNDLERDELLRFAAAAEKGSSHPLAAALTNHAGSAADDIETSDFVNHSGFGISCKLNGEQWQFGNEAMMKKSGIECQIPPGFEGMTIIFCARNDAIAGVIGAGDTLRDEAARTVADLQKLGLHCIMLTGDNIHAAELCAKNCGITEFYASLTPAGKVEKIREIAGKTSAPVIMTGDGINDAPALAQSDAGIAIGSGTAAALESAGIILPGSRLDTVVDVIALSHAVFRVIKQNLFWAFFYNFGAIPIAAGLTAALGGISLNPAICAGTMAASSLTVVLNALRLLKFRSRKNG